MDKDAIERMKKLIEEKKQASSKQGFKKKAENKIGGNRKAIKARKGGGLFDK